MLAARAAVTLAVALIVATLLERELEEPTETTETTETTGEPEPIRISRIELPRATPPEPAPKREPAPEPRTERLEERPKENDVAPPAAVVPTVGALRRGRALLEAGAFPRLRATYARIGFPAYRDAMTALGGRFFLYDVARRRTLVEVDPTTGAMLGKDVGGELSRWPRDVTRHLDFALTVGRARFGDSATRVILLPPAHLDAALLGAVDAELRARGLEAARIARLDLAYEIRDGRLRCEVLAAADREGNDVPLSLTVDLSRAGGLRL